MKKRHRGIHGSLVFKDRKVVVMSLNIELLQKVRDKIATTPEAYNQGTYGCQSSLAPCGTAACIAGWACLLSGRMDTTALYHFSDTEPAVIHDEAAEALGLDADDAEVLFTGEPQNADSDGWPAPFCYEWAVATRKEQSVIAVAYLDWIIKTGEVVG